jgi:zinc protease
MKTRTVIPLLLLVLCCMQAWPGSPAETFSVNGLKVIFVPNKANDIIAANIYFRGGSATLNMNQAGIEDLALRVARLATKNFPKEKLNAELEAMDTRVFSAAGRDYSNLSMQCVAQNFTRSWTIFTDMLLNPSFDSADVELERAQALSAIRQSKDNPDQYLVSLAMEAFYVNHPYSVDPSGTVETMTSFSGKDLRSFLRTRVVTSGMLLVVVGNTSRGDLEKMVTDSFGTLPRGIYQPSLPPAVSFQAPSVKVVRRDLPTNYITGYYPAPPVGSDESFAMILAESVLRYRLFEEVRTKRSLSYAPAAGLGNVFTNYGTIYVTAVKPDTTVTVMLNEVKKLQNEPVSEKILNDQRNGYITVYYLNTETNASQAEFLARYELSGAGYIKAENYLENIRKVTPEAIQKVCQKYMHNFQFVLLGNPGELKLATFAY